MRSAKAKAKVAIISRKRCYLSRGCPAKDKGKGGVKGEAKGMGKAICDKDFGNCNFKGQSSDPTGKGKGPARGCWIGGGSHYDSQRAACGPAAGTWTPGGWGPEVSETETIRRLQVFEIVQTAPREASKSFQALSKAENFPEEIEEPVESLNMLRRNRFCITKWNCRIAISSDSQDFIDAFTS